VDREDAAGNRQNVFCAIVCVRAKVLYYWYSLVCLVQALLPPLLKKLIGIPTGRSHLGLPPGGVAVTEVGLSPGREHNGAVLVTALGEGEREGGGAAHDLCKREAPTTIYAHCTASCPHFCGARLCAFRNIYNLRPSPPGRSWVSGPPEQAQHAAPEAYEKRPAHRI
jgi:hypothetical protein